MHGGLKLILTENIGILCFKPSGYYLEHHHHLLMSNRQQKQKLIQLRGVKIQFKSNFK